MCANNEDLNKEILLEAHTAPYSLHPGATNCTET